MNWHKTPAEAVGLIVAAAFVATTLTAFTSSPSRKETMLILRGIASDEAPRGQLDDPAAIEYARLVGYAGEVLDVSGNTGSPQVSMAVKRIRRDKNVTAIYGFSGGGYNAKSIWNQLSPGERRHIRTIVVVGSPGVSKASFPGNTNVIVQKDPPEGHMAGPKVLLETVSR